MFWNGFYTRKSQYGGVYVKVHSLSFYVSVSQTRSMPMLPLILTTTKRAWKMHFETLHNEIKCVLSVKELIFNKKRINIFTFAYCQPGRKISIFTTRLLKFVRFSRSYYFGLSIIKLILLQYDKKMCTTTLVLVLLLVPLFVLSISFTLCHQAIWSIRLFVTIGIWK